MHHGSSLEYLEHLIRKHPACLLRHDHHHHSNNNNNTGGALPLHTAIRVSSHTDPDECLATLALILRYDPAAAARPDCGDGNLPLHVAVMNVMVIMKARRGAHVEIIEHLWAAHPGAIFEENWRGQTPLAVAIAHDHVGAVALLLRVARPCSSSGSGGGKNGNEKGTPLQWALAEPYHDHQRRERRVQVIRLLLQADPQATAQCYCYENSNNDQQGFAIHAACHRGYPAAVLQALLEANPASIRYENSHHQRPLHCAIQAGCSLDVLDLLLELWRSRYTFIHQQQQVSHHQHPLHTALAAPPHAHSVRLVERLLDRDPDALSRPLANGRGGQLLTLHWFLERCVLQQSSSSHHHHHHSSVPLQLLELLLRRYPAAAAHADEARGWLPLHVAAAAASRQPSGTAMEARMVRLVREAHPAALGTPDHQGRLPLHVLVGDHSNDDDDATNNSGASSSFVFESSTPTAVRAFPVGRPERAAPRRERRRGPPTRGPPGPPSAARGLQQQQQQQRVCHSTNGAGPPAVGAGLGGAGCRATALCGGGEPR